MVVLMDDVRKLATVEEVSELRPIEGADAIQVAVIRGWSVVVKIGDFNVGDKVVYFEEDSALPMSDERFAFLAPRGVKTFEGEEYHVLKIARLRGVYSQGLVLPLDAFAAELQAFFPGSESGHLPVPGTDMTHPLGIGKWEAPLPVSGGQTAGRFRTDLARKTDSERVQNLFGAWDVIKSFEWTATEKIDGTSMTVARDLDGTLKVMGRNWEITEGDNLYWNAVRRYSKLFEPLEAGEVIQAELVGPGIQKNGLGLSDVRPFVFTVVRNQNPVPRSEWTDVQREFAVPVLDVQLPETPEELIVLVDGRKSVVTPGRLAEGVVFHTVDGSVLPEVGGRDTFKVISNKWLLKH